MKVSNNESAEAPHPQGVEQREYACCIGLASNAVEPLEISLKYLSFRCNVLWNGCSSARVDN